MSKVQIIMAIVAYLLAGILDFGYCLRLDAYSVMRIEAIMQKFLSVFLWPLHFVALVVYLIMRGVEWVAERVARS